jgi:hypothetical protein
MEDPFELYKPLRNHLRRLNLIDSLGVIHAYVQHLQFGKPFPDNIQTLPYFRNAKNRIEKRIFEWELDTLSVELLVNAVYPDSTLANDSLRQWNYFAAAINKLKTFEDALVSLHPSGTILREVHRLAHRQFPWQQPPSSSSLARYFKIFAYPDLNMILERTIGLSGRDLYRLGMALTGHFSTSFALENPPRINIPGLTHAKLDALTHRIAKPVDELRHLAQEHHVVNANYAYILNPLRQYPLVRLSTNKGQFLLAPIPTFLFRRFTDGIYYEINRDDGFAEAFGHSFQSYVGDVIKRALADTTLAVYPEEEYWVGRNRKDTADWIVVDDLAVLFVECKTKRLRHEAKMDIQSPQALEDELEILVLCLVQIYKTIHDYELGHYPPIPRAQKRNIYPVVVTLEEWFAFGPQIIKEIDKRLQEKLTLEGLNSSVANDKPYSIVSAGDFEKLVQVVALVGIDAVLAKKVVDPEPRQWIMDAFLRHAFPSELKTARFLFPEALDEIVPEQE